MPSFATRPIGAVCTRYLALNLVPVIVIFSLIHELTSATTGLKLVVEYRYADYVNRYELIVAALNSAKFALPSWSYGH